GKTIYIILLTARGAKENIVEGLRAGADDYLVKPYDKEELFARIQVGLRILDLHNSLAQRVAELEVAVTEVSRLKHDIPL
ncbi:MAG: response regulator, partial [Chthoniobacterales bacterium]|nr:response regulator [Chthoniobacterales bacterium]